MGPNPAASHVEKFSYTRYTIPGQVDDDIDLSVNAGTGATVQGTLADSTVVLPFPIRRFDDKRAINSPIDVPWNGLTKPTEEVERPETPLWTALREFMGISSSRGRKKQLVTIKEDDGLELLENQHSDGKTVAKWTPPVVVESTNQVISKQVAIPVAAAAEPQNNLVKPAISKVASLNALFGEPVSKKRAIELAPDHEDDEPNEAAGYTRLPVLDDIFAELVVEQDEANLLDSWQPKNDGRRQLPEWQQKEFAAHEDLQLEMELESLRLAARPLLPKEVYEVQGISNIPPSEFHLII